MLKLFIPSMFLIPLNKNFNMFMIMSPLLLILMLLKMYNNNMNMNFFSYLDSLSIILMMLTMMSTIMIILSTNFMNSMYPLIIPITITLLLAFSTNNMIQFYILFETILIPTTILITKLGNQPERLQAGIYLMVYTITASLPLLLSIMFMKNNMTFHLAFMSLYKFKLSTFLILAFLVKTPMFFTHLWLPKAHVEAPLEGSMILAAILLKLGGYGIIRFLPLCLFSLKKSSFLIISISIMGATMTSLNCMRQKDMKALIAYSSVAHMAMTLASIFSYNSIGLMGAIIMMFAHGMSSSALFLLVNDLYMKMHTRNIMLFKGLLSISPNISFWWFLFLAINMSAPPSINTLSEIMIISSLILWSNTLMIPIMILSLSTATFCFLLFINMNHNKNSMLIFNMSKQKTFLSLFMHLIPLILIIMKLEIMY